MFGVIKAKLSKETEEKKKVEISNLNLAENSEVVKDENLSQDVDNSIEPSEPILIENVEGNLSTKVQVIKHRFQFQLVDFVLFD